MTYLSTNHTYSPSDKKQQRQTKKVMAMASLQVVFVWIRNKHALCPI